MHAALQRVLSSPRSEKQYLVVVYGRVNVARGTLEAHLSRSRRKRRTVVTDAVSGSNSQTLFERLRRIKASPIGAALLCCRLLTGRTHQIRVHLTWLGLPVVSDSIYGPIAKPGTEVKEPLPRLGLHAAELGFKHPFLQKDIRIVAPLPRDFERTLSNLRRK